MGRPKKTVEPTTNELLADALVALKGASWSVGERDRKLHVLTEGQYSHIVNTIEQILGEE